MEDIRYMFVEQVINNAWSRYTQSIRAMQQTWKRRIR